MTERQRARQPRTAVAWSAAAAGLIMALVAMFALPWARYGAIEIMLIRFPGWGWYVVPAAALHLLALVVATAAVPMRYLRPLRYAGLAACVLALVGAGAVMVEYDNATALFRSDVVPLVLPSLGPGGPMSIVGALLAGAALVLAPSPAPSLGNGG